jgi:hypothetical protein
VRQDLHTTFSTSFLWPASAHDLVRHPRDHSEERHHPGHVKLGQRRRHSNAAAARFTFHIQVADYYGPAFTDQISVTLTVT